MPTTTLRKIDIHISISWRAAQARAESGRSPHMKKRPPVLGRTDSASESTETLGRMACAEPGRPLRAHLIRLFALQY